MSLLKKNLALVVMAMLLAAPVPRPQQGEGSEAFRPSEKLPADQPVAFPVDI